MLALDCPSDFSAGENHAFLPCISHHCFFLVISRAWNGCSLSIQLTDEDPEAEGDQGCAQGYEVNVADPGPVSRVLSVK